MTDLAPIRALLDIHMGRGASKAALHAHILAYEHLVPALLSGLAAAQAARDALRERAEHAETILTGLLPGPVSDALVDAHNHQSRTEGVSAAADWGRTVGRAQVVADAQAAPVVEWRRIRDFERSDVGAMHLHVDDKGWLIRVVDLGTEELATIAEGPETGTAGKAACEAAYRRACGRPAPVAPQVIPLHQAYEGTTACLHCGKPQPWPEMDRCPRDSRIHAIPPCAG